MKKTLPNNWVETTVGNISNVTSGYGFPIQYQGNLDNDIPFYKVGDISEAVKNGYTFLNKANNYINKDTLVKIKAKLTPKDSIVFAKIGEAIRLNRRAILLNNSVIDNNVMAITFYNIINYKLGFYYFQTVQLIELSAGNAVPSIRKTVVEEIPFPLSPLAEQERIANKLDTLFTQLDGIRTAMKRIPTLLKNFRQQVLTQAITGRLTEEWREDKELEDLSSIIENIRKKRIKENKNKNTELVRIASVYSDQSSSIDFDFFEEWIEVNLDKVCSKFAYGTSSKSEDSGKYPVIRMGNLQNGKIDWSDLKYTSDEKEYKKYGLRKGDILFNRTNSPELVGKTAIYDGKYDSIYAGYLIKIFNYEELDSRYLNIVMNTQYAKRWCWDNKTDGVSQSNINAQKLSKFTIPFPSFTEQQEIVRRVENLFSQADAIEQQYKSLKQKIDNLPQAILHKAFKGELVEQLPTDGDARDLLRQIEELKKLTKKKK